MLSRRRRSPPRRPRRRTQTTSEPRRTTPPEAPAAELDLGATVLPVLIKRYAGPVIAGIIALWLLRKILSRG